MRKNKRLLVIYPERDDVIVRSAIKTNKFTVYYTTYTSKAYLEDYYEDLFDMVIRVVDSRQGITLTNHPSFFLKPGLKSEKERIKYVSSK